MYKILIKLISYNIITMVIIMVTVSTRVIKIPLKCVFHYKQLHFLQY